MIIKSLTARFGCLCGRRLELKSGLNIITLPNEGGKSTWCAFVPAMLYGVDSRERAKRGVLPDKQRYLPWSGGMMEGEMTLVSGAREIKLTRRTLDPARPMRSFSAVYTDSGEPVSGLTAQTAGEALTGAQREVFLSSAMISHARMRSDSSPELEKRIAAIVSSGDEDSALSEAEERLLTWQRRRLYRRGGAIAETESLLDERRRALSDAKELESLRTALEKELEARQRAQAQRQALAEKAENENRRKLYERLERIKAEEAALRQAADGKNGATRRFSPPAAALAAAFLAAAVIFLLLGKTVPGAILAACAAACAVFSVLLPRGKSGLGAGSASGSGSAGERLESLAAERKALERELLAPISRQISDGETDSLRSELSEISARLLSLGSVEELSRGTAELETRLRALRRDYSAIELALTELRSAGEELSSRFSPELCSRASGYFSRITGGKYDSLSFDSALSAAAHRAGDAVSHEAEFLSSGTLDAVYFSLRLALCEMTLAPDCPIICDDALLCFDDERAEMALEVLAELSSGRQIILFTCHSREKQWLRNRIDKNEI